MWKKSTASSPSAWVRRAQFALDPHHAPRRVLGSKAQDQPHHVVWYRWATRRFGLAPCSGDQLAVPVQQRLRGDDPVGAKRLGYESGQGREYSPVGPLQPRSRVGSAQYRDLVTQQEDLRVLRRRGAGEQPQPREQLNQALVQQSGDHGRRSSSAADHEVKTDGRVLDQDRLLVRITEGVIAAIGVRLAVFPRVTRERAEKAAASRIRLVVVAAMVAVFSGLLANSGGFLLTPLYLVILRLPIKRASATSLAVSVALAVPGTITHRALGHIDWLIVLLYTASAIPAAYLGARLSVIT
jgi:hypothetical protein